MNNTAKEPKHTELTYNITLRTRNFSNPSESEKREIQLQNVNLMVGNLFDHFRSIGNEITMGDKSDFGGIIETLGCFGVGLSEYIEVETRKLSGGIEKENLDISALDLADKINKLPEEQKQSVLELIGGVE